VKIVAEISLDKVAYLICQHALYCKCIKLVFLCT